MVEPKFVHLHVHSEYSILDGACRIDKLMKRTREQGMNALAVTDHGNMFGAIDFYSQAQKHGVKPILGCELYVAPESRHKKQAIPDKPNYYHILLLAENNEGYKNLVTLSTLGFSEGFYYKPRIDKELLAANSRGLIGLSACLHGEIPYLLGKGKPKEAARAAGELSDIFGKGNFFLELMDHGMPEQRSVNRELIDLADTLGLPLVATNDCHYLDKKDAESHDVLLCIQTGRKLHEKERMKFSSDQLYLKTAQEMVQLFGHVPQAIDNTVAIAERCAVDFTFGEHKLPHFQPPEGYDLVGYFDEMCRKGLERRIREMVPEPTDEEQQEYLQRLDFEIEVIKKMGFPGYFLIVWDFIRFAKEHNIPVGPGRGSAAGSLVAYSLGITNIDPIKNQLIFERFLNPGRISMPDIDIDFCKRSRDKVIEYVTQKYGRENVSQIITFGTMAARSVIRDVGRVLDIPYAEVDKIAKLVPFELKITLEKAIEKEPKLREERDNNKTIARLLEISQVLEGLKRHPSTHAAGVVITREPLIEQIPLYTSTKGEVTTQYEMEFLEKLGLLKMDFLGLKTLTVISDTLDMLRENRGLSFTIEEIPTDDEKTFAMLGKGKTAGVFQLESTGMTELVKKLKPSVLSDLTALVALYRPGPLNSGVVDDFIRRKHGEIPVRYPLPILEPILKETYGVLLYQEQVMQTAVVMAGYSMQEADQLRKAMGKKLKAVMETHKEKFIQGSVTNGIDKKKAESIYELIAEFAEYGFNKSHAAAYGLVAYQTAYLKANYPMEYMAALMTAEQEDSEKLTGYINECRQAGIKVLPPHINLSNEGFRVSDKGIRIGLGVIKNVGASAVQEIVGERQQKGDFSSFFDFCTRVDLRTVNKRIIENLVKAGTFDCYGAHRAQVMAVIDSAISRAQVEQKNRKSGQISLFADLNLEEEIDAAYNVFPDIPQWHRHDLLAVEKEVLGFYISGHPLECYECETEAFATETTLTVKKLLNGDKFLLGGVVLEMDIFINRRKQRMMFLTIGDQNGTALFTVLPETFKEIEPWIQKDLPVLVKAQVELFNGNKKLRILEMHPMDFVRESYTRRVHITVNRERMTRELIDKLYSVIRQFPGKSEVLITMHIQKAECPVHSVLLKIHDNLRLNPCADAVQALESIIGDQALSYELAIC